MTTLGPDSERLPSPTLVKRLRNYKCVYVCVCVCVRMCVCGVRARLEGRDVGAAVRSHHGPLY